MKFKPKKMLTTIIIIAIIITLAATTKEFLDYLKKDKQAPSLAQISSETTPTTNSQPTPKVTVNPTPEVTSSPTPEVTSSPTPEVTANPTPEVTINPTPDTKDENSNITSNQDFLILVNGDNLLPEDFDVDLSKSENGKYVDSRIVDSLEQMLADCREAGHSPLLISAYRSVDYQTGLYQRQIQKYLDKGYSQDDAEAEAAKWVAIPKTSEHHTGLAVDITDSSYTTLNSSQADTDTQKWLLANHQNYGFILRYPSDKEDITKIVYEPWHYRYVGIDVAKQITDQNICLEEYLENN